MKTYGGEWMYKSTFSSTLHLERRGKELWKRMRAVNEVKAITDTELKN
jgi:hypothetical protein